MDNKTRCVGMLNIFRVNLDKIGIPESVYIYNISFKTNEEKKRIMCYKRLENIFGFVDRQNYKLYSYKRIGYLPKDLEVYLKFELQEEKSLEDLDQFVRDRIIDIYIKNVVKKDIKIVLRSLEAELLKGNKRKIGRWELSLTLEGDRIEVSRIDDQFYVIFNIKLNIIGNKNLWDWIEQDAKALQKLCWSPDGSKDVKIWLRYVPDIKTENEKNYLLVDIISKDELERIGFTFEELKIYPTEKRGLTQEELKEIAKFNSFDENQPIVRGCADLRLKSCYSFLPQYCIPAYNVVLASEEENKEIWKIREEINFTKKAEIISSIFKQLPYLEHAEGIEFKDLDDVKLKAKFVKVQLDLDKKNKVVPTVVSQPYEEEISNTADLFKWISSYWYLRSGKRRQIEVEIPIPDYIPECLENINELETFLLIEEELTKIEKSSYQQMLYSIVEAYNIMLEVYKQIGEERIPYLNFRGKRFIFENSEEGVDKVARKVSKIFQGKLGFALIFGNSKGFNEDSEESEEYYDYYIPLKAKLFNNDILSQNFLVDNYIDDKGRIDNKKIGYALSNILYNLFGKLGMKFFILEEEVSYDYILGMDVGYGEAYTGKVAGCTTIHDSEGRLRNIIPVSKENLPDKESARIKALLEHIESKYRIYKIEFDNKAILILRDGFVQPREIEQLKEFSKKKKCTIVVIGIRKGIVYQILSKKTKSCYINIGDGYLLKAHKPRVSYPRPIKIIQKVIINGENVSDVRPSEDDVLLIYKLTALNYSTIGKSSNLRVPCPIYYADKLVKALKRGWKLREDFLKDGLLYFI